MKHSQLYRERNEKICKLYLEGVMQRDIATKFDLTSARISSILSEYGIEKHKRVKKRQISYREYLELETNRLRETLSYIQKESLDVEEIKALCGDALAKVEYV